MFFFSCYNNGYQRIIIHTQSILPLILTNVSINVKCLGLGIGMVIDVDHEDMIWKMSYEIEYEDKRNISFRIV